MLILFSGFLLYHLVRHFQGSKNYIRNFLILPIRASICSKTRNIQNHGKKTLSLKMLCKKSFSLLWNTLGLSDGVTMSFQTFLAHDMNPCIIDDTGIILIFVGFDSRLRVMSQGNDGPMLIHFLLTIKGK